jgi:hypothetical protein
MLKVIPSNGSILIESSSLVEIKLARSLELAQASSQKAHPILTKRVSD